VCPKLTICHVDLDKVVIEFLTLTGFGNKITYVGSKLTEVRAK